MEFSQEDLEFIKNNDGIKEIIESYIPFYKKYFCFTDTEIEALITRLISTHDQDLILNLLELYENFVNEESEIFDFDERQRLAKKAVNLSIEVYSNEKEKALQEFKNILKDARSLGIDPIKLVNKTNMTKASFDSYCKCIDALQGQLYTDPILKTKFSLIDSDDDQSGSLVDFIEQCTTVICKMNQENVQEVINLLAEFFYDKDSGTYIMQAKNAVLKVKTLLTTSPEKLKENMDFFEEVFASPSISSVQIKTAVSRCPSSLLISKNNLTGFMQAFKSNLTSIIDKANSSSEKLSAKELMQMFGSQIEITDEDMKTNSKTYMEFIDDVTKTFCLENLGNIYTMNSENVSEMPKFSNVFIKPFGIKNSISCLQDFNFLSTDPDLLDYIFTIAEESEKAGHKNLREFILRHSARSVKLAREMRTKTSENKPEDFVQELTETPKRKRTLYALPKISELPGDIEQRRKKLTNSQIKTAEKLLEQIIAESRDSNDLDIELIAKLDKTAEEATPYLTMLRRAETAISYLNGEKNSAETLKNLQKFISTYKSYILILSRMTRQYEQAKTYYQDKKRMPEKAFSPYDSVDGLSVSDALKVMEERSDQLFTDQSVILKAYKNLKNVYAEMLKNPYVDKEIFDDQISSLLGENRTMIKIEASAYVFLRKIKEELERLFPEKSMEIIGQENYDKYLDYPFISGHLIMYMTMVGFKNSNFLYVVRRNNDFEEIPYPDASLRRSNPQEYQSRLKQHNFEHAYLDIETIIDENITNFKGDDADKQFSVSPYNRSITSNGITLVSPKINENDYDPEADEALEEADEYIDIFPLTAKGIIKMLNASPALIKYIQQGGNDDPAPGGFGE